MKQCHEFVRGLRYKLQILGISVNGHAFIYGNNQLVLCNTTIPKSTITKEHHSIAYHVVYEGVAKGKWITCYVLSHLNTSDTITKTAPSGEKRDHLVGNYVYESKIAPIQGRLRRQTPKFLQQVLFVYFIYFFIFQVNFPDHT